MCTYSWRASRFIEHLYREKEIHKEQRHKHVIHKLVLSSSFFGLGQITTISSLYHFLYIVPFIALVHDVYIFAEHFKVHRVGAFLRYLSVPPACYEEIAWEKYARSHPEKRAYWASFAYTFLITAFSGISLYSAKPITGFIQDKQFIYWLILCALATIAVFGFSLKLRIQIRDIEEELGKKKEEEEKEKAKKETGGNR